MSAMMLPCFSCDLSRSEVSKQIMHSSAAELEINTNCEGLRTRAGLLDAVVFNVRENFDPGKNDVLPHRLPRG